MITWIILSVIAGFIFGGATSISRIRRAAERVFFVIDSNRVEEFNQMLEDEYYRGEKGL